MKHVQSEQVRGEIQMFRWSAMWCGECGDYIIDGSECLRPLTTYALLKLSILEVCKMMQGSNTGPTGRNLGGGFRGEICMSTERVQNRPVGTGSWTVIY